MTPKHKYYIFTPANFCSGGPEALHQLAFYMRKLGLDAYTVYYTYTEFPNVLPIERYNQYNVVPIAYKEIDDIKGNYVIAPESAPWCLNGFRNAKKCIWWLGLVESDLRNSSIIYKIVYWKRRLFKQSIVNAKKLLFNPHNCWHLCGSRYAYSEVSSRFPQSRVAYLIEPISLDFLQVDNMNKSLYREDFVLYNPAKPSEMMTQLLARKRFRYIPLEGLTPQDLAEMYQKSKLYVDFGEFGGPERMPKEAVYFGCNILVANHNAAVNDFDVAIPHNYKIADSEDIETVETKISYMLMNYQSLNRDFQFYRNQIEKLEDNFTKQIMTIFD